MFLCNKFERELTELTYVSVCLSACVCPCVCSGLDSLQEKVDEHDEDMAKVTKKLNEERIKKTEAINKLAQVSGQRRKWVESIYSIIASSMHFKIMLSCRFSFQDST